MDIKTSAGLFLSKADFVCDISLPDAIEAVIGKIVLTRDSGRVRVENVGLAKNFTLIVLAGGKSSRMGTDKSGLSYQGHSFLENLVAKGLMHGFSEVITSGAREGVFGARNIMDELPGMGPLGGLHSCLKHAKSPYCFVVAVDTPKIGFDGFAGLMEAHLSGGNRITVLRAGGMLEPLMGAYNSDLYHEIDSMIRSGSRKTAALFDIVKCGVFDYTGDAGSLDNINTPEDYRCLQDP
jgi:molybdopterin-guanine dinucleotide biosynthesis protein A